MTTASNEWNWIWNVMVSVAMESSVIYLLVCAVFEAQAEVVLLQQVKMLTHFEEQELTLCPFLQERERRDKKIHK